jgi:hypothetical protein
LAAEANKLRWGAESINTEKAITSGLGAITEICLCEFMIKPIDCLGSRFFFYRIVSMKAQKEIVWIKYFFNAIVEEPSSTLREFNLRLFT